MKIEVVDIEEVKPYWGSMYDDMFARAAKLQAGDWIAVRGISAAKRFAIYTYMVNRKINGKYSIISTGDIASEKAVRLQGAANVMGDIAITPRIKDNATRKYIREQLTATAV